MQPGVQRPRYRTEIVQKGSGVGPCEGWDSVKLSATPLTHRKVSQEVNSKAEPRLSQGSRTEGGAEVQPRLRGCVDLVIGNDGNAKARLGK